MESPIRAPAGTQVIETFGWDGAAPRLAAHLDRAQATCARLGFAFDRAAAEAAVAALSGPGPLRVRLTVAQDGTLTLTTAPAGPPPGRWLVGLARDRLHADDPWLRIKTTQRALYDRTRADLPVGLDEVVFLNDRGQVCEGTITTVFLERDGVLLTPPVACGCLPGVLRAALLDAGRATEAVLTLPDLGTGRLWLGNSLRGLIAADWVGDRAAPGGGA